VARSGARPRALRRGDCGEIAIDFAAIPDRIHPEAAMATLTIKGIPDALYQRLKRRAAAEHRSINRQAILLLEQELARETVDVKAWLAENARLRKRYHFKPTSMADIDADKRRGRP
jgi:antitoxin FitA